MNGMDVFGLLVETLADELDSAERYGIAGPRAFANLSPRPAECMAVWRKYLGGKDEAETARLFAGLMVDLVYAFAESAPEPQPGVE